MMQFIRNLGISWISILMGFSFLLSGMAMTNGNTVDRTLLCFDSGCIHVQGLTCMSMGVLFIGFGIYAVLKRKIYNHTIHRIKSYQNV